MYETTTGSLYNELKPYANTDNIDKPSYVYK